MDGVGPRALGELHLHELHTSALEVLDLFRGVPRSEWLNRVGGDVGAAGSARLLLRHTAHYLSAALFAAERGIAGQPVLDVGSGVGAYGVWMARRLGAPLALVDRCAPARAAAGAAFPGITVYADIAEVPTGSAHLVCAMDVIEHIAFADQEAFCAELARVAAPGGLIVLATPDERGFIGGSSGYAAHIGCLGPEQLAAVLRNGAGLEPEIWRLDGEPFRIGRLERYRTPLTNRVWAVAARASPDLERSLSWRVQAVASRLQGWAGPRDRTPGPSASRRMKAQLNGSVTARLGTPGPGTGILALLEVPAAAVEAL